MAIAFGVSDYLVARSCLHSPHRLLLITLSFMDRFDTNGPELAAVSKMAMYSVSSSVVVNRYEMNLLSVRPGTRETLPKGSVERFGPGGPMNNVLCNQKLHFYAEEFMSTFQFYILGGALLLFSPESFSSSLCQTTSSRSSLSRGSMLILFA